jgi:hypothetical protein
LSHGERLDLDAPLTIEELDKSVDKCNLKSAPGADGLSNTFIKKYWHLLRVPLFRYANRCYDSGELTVNFRSAIIKLIPKKGNTELIKNWRPISLLSNLYKIISRAINNRLNKVVNRICSRSQKGFNSNRFTQECLINVIENIQYCNSTGENGAIVAVDMAKAFDTLSHGFVREVLKFFNFGPNLIRWLTLLGENRSASIIIDDGVYSRPFELGRGRAQGDNISPTTFNFAEQILLFKIELDSSIASIGRHRNIPIDFPVNNDPFFMHEARGETSKNESLADDNTTITKYEKQSLLRLREVLVDFACVSSLHCNFDKTMVMPVGSAVLTKQRLGDFTVTNQITLLGLEINNNLDNVEDIFMKIANKINPRSATATYTSPIKITFVERIKSLVKIIAAF